MILISVAVLIGALLSVFITAAQEDPLHPLHERWLRDWEDLDCGEKTMTVEEAGDWILQEYSPRWVSIDGSPAKGIMVVGWSEKHAEAIPECVGGWPVKAGWCDSAEWRSATGD